MPDLGNGMIWPRWPSEPLWLPGAYEEWRDSLEPDSYYDEEDLDDRFERGEYDEVIPQGKDIDLAFWTTQENIFNKPLPNTG